MEGKHTPGPWIVHRRKLDALPKSFLQRVAVDVESNHLPGEYVLLADCGPDGFAENEANAYLIAAAPELLEALQGIIDCGKRDLTNPKYDGYFIDAEAAIAKAGGKV